MTEPANPRDDSRPDGSDVDPVTPPSRRNLMRATIGAVAVGVLLTLGVVLPAEYGRDPLGTGALLGLTEMGRIKVSLAEELIADSLQDAAALADSMSVSGGATIAPGLTPQRDGDALGDASRVWRDSVTLTLQPNQGVEYKLTMQKGEHAFYEWSTDSTMVNFDLHGDPTDRSGGAEDHSYRRGSSRLERGDVVAVFDGVHGWFWRNRSTVPVTLLLRTGGEYLELREMK